MFLNNQIADSKPKKRRPKNTLRNLTDDALIELALDIKDQSEVLTVAELEKLDKGVVYEIYNRKLMHMVFPKRNLSIGFLADPDGHSVAEIASELEMSHQNVDKLIKRALHHFRAELLARGYTLNLLTD